MVTPFEGKASEIAASLAGHPVAVECESGTTWKSLGARLRYDPARSWAMTPFHWDSAVDGPAPDGTTHFSPRACRHADAFWLAPTEQRARNCGDARRSSQCADWPSKLTAVHVLTHESVHLHGFYREANADCLAVQLDGYVAAALGANQAFARSLAREFWRDSYAPRTDSYRSPDCREGGRLDLFPGRRGWPTPVSYPHDLASSLAALEARLRAAGHSP